MKVRVFSIYDSKTEAYMKPFLLQTKGHALRAFQDLVNDGQSLISKHPNDFSLFEIAEYDEEKAEFTNHLTKINLGGAWELVKTQEDKTFLPGMKQLANTLTEERPQ